MRPEGKAVVEIINTTLAVQYLESLLWLRSVKNNAGKSQVARESVVKLNTDQPSSAQSNSVINDREYIDKSWDEYRNEADD